MSNIPFIRKHNFLYILVGVVILFSSVNCECGTILASLHTGSTPWWFAVSFNGTGDTTINRVDAKASNSEAWTVLDYSNWGHWVYVPDGQSIAYPISIQLNSATKGSLVFNNLFSANDAGVTYDTGASFGSSTPTVYARTEFSENTGEEGESYARSAPDQVEINQDKVNSWEGGAQYTVIITNNAQDTLTELQLSSPDAFVQTWGIEQREGGYFVLPDYVTANGGIGSGTSFSFGYVSSSATPATFTITSASFGEAAEEEIPVVEEEQPEEEQPAEESPAPETPIVDDTSSPVIPPSVTVPPESVSPATVPAPGEATTVTGNPFDGADMFVPPYYTSQIQATINANPGVSSLSHVEGVPVAFWLDNIAKVGTLNSVLAAARGQQADSGKPVVVTIVVYDLPNRDCAALASNGEIPCADADCVDGLTKYKTEYIDLIMSDLKNYPELRTAAIIEPDSLPNLVTNLAVPKCTQADKAYKQGVAYAVQQLATLPNVASYIDAAHGGWIGWTTNLASLSSIFSEVLTAAGGADKIRGFSTNVANLQPLGTLDSTDDPCGLAAQYNFAINEVAYSNLLSSALAVAGITDKHFIIDTSRNGAPNSRASCQNWCNINGAGLGERPVASPAGLGVSNIDALLWVKPPGESDGTSDTTAVRYDAHCGSVDSVTPAPEAGQWFPSYFLMLCENASPAI